MVDHISKVEIRPISEWCNLAVKAKRNGCPNPTMFLLHCTLANIIIPTEEYAKIRQAWQRDE